MERRLSAILAADVVGYSRLMEADEKGTLEALKALRQDLVDPKIAKHHGRIVKLMGDGALIEFASVVEAVQCAVEIQQSISERTANAPKAKCIDLRIGIHVGDVIVEGDDIYGDGVNVASRLETLAETGGICVSEVVHQSIASQHDLIFEDQGERSLKNIERKVRVWQWAPEAAYASGTPTSIVHSYPLPEKPSIAVLPFENMSDDPEQEYFSDGISEDIITALSRSPWLFVIARNSSFTYRKASVDVKQIAHDLGVRYVLEGSVRKAGKRLRVTAQLIDGLEGEHVWAENYDGTLEDVFDLQDEITRKVVSSLHTQIRLSEGAKPLTGERLALRSWDLLRRAWKLFYEQRPDSLAQARLLMEQAIEVDPGFSEAYYVLAGCLAHEFYLGTSLDDGATLKRALDLAKHSIILDDTNEYAHWVLGFIYLHCRLHDQAVAELERAIELNPNCSLAFGTLGTVLAYAGQAERSIASNEMAIRSNPRDPSMFYRHIGLAVANFVAGRYSEGAKWAKNAIARRPDFDVGHAVLTACYSYLGQDEAMHVAATEYLTVLPEATISDLARLPFKNSADFERLVESLRKAGIPE